MNTTEAPSVGNAQESGDAKGVGSGEMVSYALVTITEKPYRRPRVFRSERSLMTWEEKLLECFWAADNNKRREMYIAARRVWADKLLADAEAHGTKGEQLDGLRAELYAIIDQDAPTEHDTWSS